MLQVTTRLSTVISLFLFAIAGGIVPASAQEMLQLHNAKRTRHCAPAMTWSATMAAQAAAYAKQCNFNHSAASTRPGQGENLAWGSGAFASASNSADRWYNEVAKYNFSAPGFSSATGHFTQMVWKGSTQLGCGSAVCSGQTFWVCRYAPGGNITNPGQFAANVLPTSCAGAGPVPGPKPGPAPGPKPGPTPAPTPGSTPTPGTQGAPGTFSAFATDGRGRWGFSTHRATQAIATAQAVQGCGGAGAGCKVFWTTTNKCVSFAESRSGGYWFAAGGGQTPSPSAAVGDCIVPARACTRRDLQNDRRLVQVRRRGGVSS